MKTPFKTPIGQGDDLVKQDNRKSSIASEPCWMSRCLGILFGARVLVRSTVSVALILLAVGCKGPDHNQPASELCFLIEQHARRVEQGLFSIEPFRQEWRPLARQLTEVQGPGEHILPSPSHRRWYVGANLKFSKACVMTQNQAAFRAFKIAANRSSRAATPSFSLPMMA